MPGLSGKGTWDCTGALVRVVAGAALVPFVLEQAHSDARAAMAAHAIMSFFIKNVRVLLLYNVLTPCSSRRFLADSRGMKSGFLYISGCSTPTNGRLR